jgi:hypothetical protein
MKLRLSILLLAAAALAVAPAAGQTIKSLGYNTTNGNIVAATNVTFTNSVGFATNARAATRTNLGGTTVGNAVFTATNAAAAATAIGLGATNYPTFRGLEVVDGDALYINTSGINAEGFGGQLTFEERQLTQDGATVFAWSSNSFAVTPPATFSTNVSIAGSLSVGSFTTTTPSTWALDATQTAAATNGRLTLPSNANVIRLTNNNAISSVTNGVLGAFYYLVNQATNAVTISNVGGITVDGAQNLTLSPNESATLVATGATNVSVANRGDLTDVALGGTANTAPSQTASSGSSLMTRELSDDRYLGEFWHAWRMSAYNTTNIPVAVFKTAPCVLYTNGQSAFYVEAFLDTSKYAGKTVRVLAYCRVDSTNGGNVQGVGQIKYLTNNAGGADPNFPITVGGQAHGTIGIYTNVNTDVFPVATSTNQYLIFTSNVGTIPNNATMIIATFGFNRATNLTTFTNNLYMQGVQVVVE